MRLEINDNILYIDKMKYGCITHNEDSTEYKGCKYLLDNPIENSGISNETLKTLVKEDLIEDLFIAVISSEIFYISKKNDIVYLTSNFEFNLLNWDKPISVKQCYDYLSNCYGEIEKLSFSIESDNYFDIYIENEVNNKETIFDTFLRSKEKLDEILFEAINEFKVEKIINFSAEYLTAGISILQYFGKLLQEKYPNEKVSVSIKQQDLKVTMTIETPDGKKEEIEEYLNRYGMVVTNQITPQEFASNPIQLIELKQELREAQNKILFQQELLSLKDDTYKNRIKSLEDEVNFLRKEFSTILLTNKKNIEVLLNSLLIKDKLIKKLTKSIENRNNDETKQLLLELKEKDSKGYISLKQHIDNAIIGGIVNAPSWIQFTVGILSKVG